MAEGLAFTVSLVDLITAPAKVAAGSVTKLRGALADIQPTTTQGKAAMADLSGTLEAIEPVAGAATEALTAVAGAIAAGAAMAIKASEAKAQILSTFDALGGGVFTGKQAIAMFDELGDKTGMTREQLAPLTKEFLAMGVNSTEALKSMTLAAASAQAIMGSPAASNAFVTLQKKIQLAVDTGNKLKLPTKSLAQLAEMGVNVTDVAGKMGVSAETLTKQLKAGTVNAEKFGQALTDALITKGTGPLDRMSKSVEALRARFFENVQKMFEDVDPGPFLNALKSIGALFDQNTESGKTMKFIVTSFFNGVFKIAARVMPIIKHLLLEMVIAALRIYIAAKPLVAELKKLFGASDGETLTTALRYVVEFMADGIIFTIKFYTVMLKLWEGIGKTASVIADFVSSAGQIATAFIDGLVGGITSGALKVVNAVKNLGQQAVSAVKSTLKISSPSRVMLEMGQHTATGFAEGITAGAPTARGAVTDMVKPPAATASAPSRGGGGPVAVTLNVYGVENAQDLKADLPGLLAQAFEKLALMGGA